MPIVFRPSSKSGKFSSPLLLGALLLMLFGGIILIKPEILAYIIAWMFILSGITLLSIWIQLR